MGSILTTADMFNVVDDTTLEKSLFIASVTIWIRSASGVLGGTWRLWLWLSEGPERKCRHILMSRFAVVLWTTVLTFDRILGITFDSKVTVERHVRDIVASASCKLRIPRKANAVFDCPTLTSLFFWSFVLHLLEYCAPVWASAAPSHLHLLDRVVRNASFLSSGNVICNLSHRRQVRGYKPVL